MKHKFCIYCGAENDVNAKKCLSCNADLVVIDDIREPEGTTPQASEPAVSKNYAHLYGSQNANSSVSKNDAPFAASQNTEVPEPTVNIRHSEPLADNPPPIPPYYATPVTYPEYYEPAVKSKKSGTSAIAKIFTVILCIILFISLAATAALYTVYNVTTPDNIEKWVDELDLYEAAELLTGETFMEEDQEYTITFGSYKIQNIYLKSVKKVVNSKEVKGFVAEKLACYIDDLKTESGKGYIDEDDIIDLLRGDKKDEKDGLEGRIRKAFGYAPTENDYKEIKKILKDMNLEDYDLSFLREEEPELFNAVSLALSLFDYIFYGAVALDILLIAAIILINLKRVSSGIKAVGITFIPSGIIFGGIFAAANFVTEKLNDDFKEYWDIFYPLGENAVNNILLIGITLVAVGFITVVTVGIARAVSKRARRKKEAAADGIRY